MNIPTMKQVKQVSEREKGIVYIIDGNSSLVMEQRPIIEPFSMSMQSNVFIIKIFLGWTKQSSLQGRGTGKLVFHYHLSLQQC